MYNADNILDSLEMSVSAIFFGAAVIIAFMLLSIFGQNIRFASKMVDEKQSVYQSSEEIYHNPSAVSTNNLITREQAVDMLLTLAPGPKVDITVVDAGGGSHDYTSDQTEVVEASRGDEASIRAVTAYFHDTKYIQRNVFDAEEVHDTNGNLIDHRDVLARIELRGTN